MAESDGLIRVTIIRLTGDTFEVSLDATASVDKLKSLVEEEIGLAPCLQSLVLGETPLQDGSRIQDYDIKEGSILTLLQLDGLTRKVKFTVVSVNGEKDEDEIDIMVGETLPQLIKKVQEVRAEKAIKAPPAFQVWRHTPDDGGCCVLTGNRPNFCGPKVVNQMNIGTWTVEVNPNHPTLTQKFMGEG
eukprot:TRINITY_DN99526_c0_g1_i1.p1 TRINITY_DN99526_c0_g1~~TRINITY_DN99526_c0_g1_i1.p1  ORF type:complete len:188 (-),score=21.04 TRINITY_DN99526_c0_g1_i1:417-980(-)